MKSKTAAGTSRAAARKSAGKPASQMAENPRPGAGTPGAADSVASRLPQIPAAEIAAAKEKFERGIISRGEAVKAGKPLPPGATHEIVTDKHGGPPVLKRKRFSIK
jgi:hypothetical protein